MMNRYLTASAATLLMVVGTIATAGGRGSSPGGQDEARRLFESGKYGEAIAKASDDSSPQAQYLKGLAHRKLDQNDDAKAAFNRVAQAGGAWQGVGESAVALTDGNLDGALAAAKNAVGQNGGLAQAQYQLGLVLDARSEHADAAAAFAKAAEAEPQMAYAHYNAGLNYYKAKRIDRMAVFFENFLKLAPDSPEKPAVESIMRTVRGR
jgi:tetratricopeptide (TPR) repeat protein